MGALSFLNQSNAPSASSNYSQSSSQLPSWYTDYTQQILNKAAQFAAQPYQTYQGPRIASQSNLTNDAYSAAPNIANNASAQTQAAQNLVTQGVAQNNNIASTAAPSYAQASADFNNSIAPGSGGLAAASGTLNQADADTGAGAVQAYMNPYNQDVTSAIANAANTNFQNYTLPGLQSSIIGSGNITGSSTEGANLIENAEQQNEQNINNAQASALQSGYNSSLSAAQNAASTQAGIGSTLGALGTAQQTATQNAGTDLTNLGTQKANLVNTQAQNDVNAGATASGINTAGTNNAIAASNNENTLGQQNQGYNQSNLNLAYQDYLNQLNYPMTQATEMQSALSGIQVPSATVNYNYGTGINGGNGSASTTGASPLQSIFGSAVGTAASAATPSTTNPGANVGGFVNGQYVG